MLPEPVNNSVTGLTGAMSSAFNTLPSVRQMTSEDDLSADDEVIPGGECLIREFDNQFPVGILNYRLEVKMKKITIGGTEC